MAIDDYLRNYKRPRFRARPVRLEDLQEPMDPEVAAALSATFAAATNLTQLRKSTDQNLPGSTFTAITFDVEDYDTLGLHDNVTNNTRLTVPTGQDGLYEFSAMAIIYGGTGDYYLQFHKNGTPYPGRSHHAAPSNGYADISLVRMMALAAGDYVEIKADSEGGTRTIGASLFSGEAQTVLQARRLGPAPI